jgi:predicted ArsR family transcriptional regulator
MAKDSNDSKTLPLIEESAKRGRPKQSELTRAEQTRLAQKRYRERQKEKLMTLSKSVESEKTPDWLENENLELIAQIEELKTQLSLKDNVIKILRDELEQAKYEADCADIAAHADMHNNQTELYALIKKTCKYYHQNPEQPFLITLSGTLGNNMPWEGNGNEYGLGDLDYYVKDHSGKLRKMLTATNKD